MAITCTLSQVLQGYEFNCKECLKNLLTLMFLTSKQSEFDNAILLSPEYNYYSTSLKCVQLWYHAYGKTE